VGVKLWIDKVGEMSLCEPEMSSCPLGGRDQSGEGMAHQARGTRVVLVAGEINLARWTHGALFACIMMGLLQFGLVQMDRRRGQQHCSIHGTEAGGLVGRGQTQSWACCLLALDSEFCF
jgi:hypothetical protein